MDGGGDVHDQQHQDDPHIQEELGGGEHLHKQVQGGGLWHQLVKVVQEMVWVGMINIMKCQRQYKEDVFRRREEEWQMISSMMWRNRRYKHLLDQLSKIVRAKSPNLFTSRKSM